MTVTLTDAQVQQIQGLLNQIQGFLIGGANGIPVPAGSNLQAAIDSAPAGSTLLIAPGDYAPIIVGKPLTLMSTAPPLGRRVLGTDPAGSFFRIKGTGVPAVTLTAPVTLIGLWATRTDANPPIVSITGDWTSGQAILLGCWVQGSALGSRRGIEANGCATLIRQCRVENCWFAGQDAQAVAGWTGPGPLTIDDCYLEGSGETVILGGADAIDQAHQPKNFTLMNSLLTKQLGWKAKPGTVKNTLELKNCVGFTIQDNTIEYSWVDGQIGFLFQITPRNQDGTNPWATVSNGVVQRNLFRHGAGGVNILGTDNNNPSGRVMNIRFAHNRFEDVDPVLYGQNGRMIQITSGPDGLTFDHNTLLGAHPSSFMTLGNFGEAVKTTRFVFINNIVLEGEYGIAGDTTGQGAAALAVYAPGAVFTNNAIIQGGFRPINYPPANYVLPPGTSPVGLSQPTTDALPIGA